MPPILHQSAALVTTGKPCSSAAKKKKKNRESTQDGHKSTSGTMELTINNNNNSNNSCNWSSNSIEWRSPGATNRCSHAHRLYCGCTFSQQALYVNTIPPPRRNIRHTTKSNERSSGQKINWAMQGLTHLFRLDYQSKFLFLHLHSASVNGEQLKQWHCMATALHGNDIASIIK